MHTTAHSCEGPHKSGDYDACDKVGKCVLDIPADKFGEGSLIDTKKPFVLTTEFMADGGYKQIFEQGENKYEQSTTEGCEKANLKPMAAHLEKGMTIAMSQWGGAYGMMSWLDGGKCTDSCNADSEYSMKNIEITEAAYLESPAKKAFEYGEPCSTTHEGECTGCGSCSWSWPQGDSMKQAS